MRHLDFWWGVGNITKLQKGVHFKHQWPEFNSFIKAEFTEANIRIVLGWGVLFKCNVNLFALWFQIQLFNQHSFEYLF